MRYVTKEQFEAQSPKVRNTLLTWWKPRAGDIVVNKFGTITIREDRDIKIAEKYKETNLTAFTVCQLLEFIEDHTDDYAEIEVTPEGGKCVLIGGTYSVYWGKQNESLLDVVWKTTIKLIEDSEG